MAKIGHTVVGVDVDSAKVESLAQGRTPFFEPGFEELLTSAMAQGHLSFSDDIAAVAGCDVHFICVGTPQLAGARGADLRYVRAAVAGLAPVLAGGGTAVVAGKSTVPVGTARSIASELASTSPNAILVWNPEFLREGLAVQDTLEPDRIVYGLPAGDRGAIGAHALDLVYAEALERGTPKIETDYETAELVKVAANSFLALKISFINGVARICDATGANVKDLSRAIGLDDRIGRKFLRAGIGFGGGCLPKDLRAFSTRAAELDAGEFAALLDNVDRINTGQRERLVDLVARLAGRPDEGLAGAAIGILGAAFKPGTDDVRDSPSLAIARALADKGATVRIYDPAAGPNLRRQLSLARADQAMPRAQETGGTIEVVRDVREAAGEAAAVLLLTEWPEFVELDPTDLADAVNHRVIIDGRDALDPARWRTAGWEYHGVGVR
jgi:UDPglucose 6-dehydrogenase